MEEVDESTDPQDAQFVGLEPKYVTHDGSKHGVMKPSSNRSKRQTTNMSNMLIFLCKYWIVGDGIAAVSAGY